MFCDAFSYHLSPYQFEVAIKGSCEVMMHDIRSILNVHPYWVLQVNIINVFNIINSHKVIFQNLHVAIG
jgi:hypothetical protein